MKTASIYAADVDTDMENSVRRIQPAQRLAMHSPLPTTTQELTVDEQAVCDMATD